MTRHHGAEVTPEEVEVGTPVLAADRVRVGFLAKVVVDDRGAMTGLVIDARTGPGGHRQVEAAQVVALHEEAVLLRIDGQACEDLPAPEGADLLDAEPAAPPLAQRVKRAWALLSGRA